MCLYSMILNCIYKYTHAHETHWRYRAQSLDLYCNEHQAPDLRYVDRKWASVKCHSINNGSCFRNITSYSRQGSKFLAQTVSAQG